MMVKKTRIIYDSRGMVRVHIGIQVDYWFKRESSWACSKLTNEYLKAQGICVRIDGKQTFDVISHFCDLEDGIN